MIVRDGKLIHTEHFSITHQNALVQEILEKFLLQYYEDASDLPREIFTAQMPNQSELIEKALSKLRKTKVEIIVPTRGRKKQLVSLAAENAKMYFAAHEMGEPRPDSSGRELHQVLISLQKNLNLPKLPRRIEGYDISNIQGTNPVGSMVVFADGKPDKSQYRKFKINLKDTPDDFAMMKEVLERRFKRLAVILSDSEGSRDSSHFAKATEDTSANTPQNDNWGMPDLVIIDGGKGQLNVAVVVLKNYNLNIPVIGLAKRLEEVFLPGKKNPIVLPDNSLVLFLLQRIRDEAHRFAITFYRGRHNKQTVRSILDEISGVGPVTKKKLLRKFGSASAIRSASLEALAAEVGMQIAKKIKENL